MKLKNPEQIRKDFELSMVFGIEGVPSGQGCLQRDEHGNYKNAAVDLAFRGYRACAESLNAQLERVDTARYISNGMRTEVRHELGLNPAFWPDVEVDRMIRSALKVCGDTPT